ncbi:hypothetical protein BSR22_00720 [Prochlorococcus sp. RSP50]|nr:hypothetical protein BSR22_00720 [Prochlorococcus sp. RS50]AQL31580.1 hypothetical protein BS620_00755 [Prochlorococcus sp. RS01]AQL34532.1 hypothetical protein BS621_07075 [Prochlorococcus sp. RS04]
MSKKNFQYIKRFWKFFSKRRKKQFFFAIFLMFSSSLADLISLSTALPFFYITISNKEGLRDNQVLRFIYDFFNLNNSNQLVILTSFFFASTVILSLFIKILNIKYSQKLSAYLVNDLSSKAYFNVLSQSYEFHIRTNSSDLIARIVNFSDKTGIVFNQTLYFLSSIVTSIGLFSAFLIVNWKIAFFSISFICFIYFFLIYFLKGRVSKISKLVSEITTYTFKNIQEGIGSIREVILGDLQNVYVDAYRKPNLNLRYSRNRLEFWKIIPKFGIEAFLLLGVTIFTLIFSLYIQNPNPNLIIPVLGFIALGFQRLLPNLQQIYFSWLTITGDKEVVNRFLDLVELEPNVINKKYKKNIFNKSADINIENLYFRYLNSEKEVIRNLKLQIKSKEKVAFIGKSGCGKSTLLDLIMGLLKPSIGRILVNGIDINKRNMINQWRSSIAHVPQNIFLTDTSIIENIALGITKSEIDYDKVKRVCETAQIQEFIESTEFGYETIIGERGISLSGGQRQRIGIARALYKASSILILDEATSALDNLTEKKVIEAIFSTSKDLTVILVAHRLSTVKYCDKVIRISEGKIEESYKP